MSIVKVLLEKLILLQFQKNLYLQHPRKENKTKLIPENYVSILLEPPIDDFKFEYYTGRIIDFTDDSIFLKITNEDFANSDSGKNSYYISGGPIKKIQRSSIDKMYFEKKSNYNFTTIGTILTTTALANSLIFAQFLSINYNQRTFNKPLWLNLQAGSVPIFASGVISILWGTRKVYIASTNNPKKRQEWILKKSN